MANFIDAVKQRRTNYALGKEIPVSEGLIVETIQTVVREVPSAFNMQSGKVVVALGAVHDRIWEITMDTLRPIVAPANFAATEQILPRQNRKSIPSPRLMERSCFLTTRPL